ncbi:heavy-metal-associated domain-containing protein [Austwickia chelonae]|uniref:heavy-metal-associated domain-containing protein n=1 Tax=Austwickia chelonae TaxID=100225 RepID=UPI000E27C484|nr:heavy-metal-associated domain-containing protein [Austwickia chelonae]
MITTTLKVNGLTCGNCVKHLTEELQEIPGVTAVDIDLVTEGTSTAVVTSDAPLTGDAIAHAVDEAGYDLVAVQE